jgi:ABC-type transport system involved in Fe-S cluster assembly fused permease/ATPase subunit
MAFLSLLSLVQSLVVWAGLAAGLVYCVWGSSRGRVSVGDTVLFISMMQQLYVPLTFFGSYYRQVRASTPASGNSQSARRIGWFVVHLRELAHHVVRVPHIHGSSTGFAVAARSGGLRKLHEVPLFAASGDQGID